MASVASSRLYIGMRMSTWWGTWTMIQWRKKSRPTGPQDRGALHLTLELVPVPALPPADVGLHVVDVHERADHEREGQERDDQHLGDHPGGAGTDPDWDPPERTSSRAGHQDEAQHHEAVDGWS